MSWWEILLVSAIALFAVGIIVISVIRKKQGKSSSCHDCACCPHSKGCESAKKNVNTNK
jgi:hypothetical protein